MRRDQVPLTGGLLVHRKTVAIVGYLSACAAGYAPQLMMATIEANARFREAAGAPALETSRSR